MKNTILESRLLQILQHLYHVYLELPNYAVADFSVVIRKNESQCI